MSTSTAIAMFFSFGAVNWFWFAGMFLFIASFLIWFLDMADIFTPKKGDVKV